LFWPQTRYAAVVDQCTVRLADVEPYRPGESHRRELPTLRAVLADAGPLDLLIVDGFVDLDPDSRPGSELGRATQLRRC
jgi:deoxyribonuclease V